MTPSAKTLAASIDTKTLLGWNIRALLWRLADGDDWRVQGSAAEMAALAKADGLGLVDIDVLLTTLGEDVAAWLRPDPWRVVELDDSGGFGVEDDDRDYGGVDDCIRCDSKDRAELIATLLTEHYEGEAKVYKTEPTRPRPS